MELKQLAVVSVGGIFGSLGRWGVSLLILDDGFPWATLIVNYVGAIILMFIVLVSDSPNLKLGKTWWWRHSLGAGFCGGFTTYSAFALKIDQYLTAHSVMKALIYSSTSIIGSYLLLMATQKLFRAYFPDNNQKVRKQP